MKIRPQFAALLLLFFFAAAVPAQMAPGQGAMPGLDQALRKLFDGIDGFTSTAIMSIDGGGQNVKLMVETSMLNGDTRTEVDLSKMEGAAMPPAMINQLKAAGMDKVVTISYAKDGSSLMMYPGLKSYAMVEAPKTAAGDKPSEPTIEKTVLGNETVDGRECEKSTVKIKSEGSAEVVMTVWADKGRKNLPVKIATSDSGVNLVMEFRDFKETKPDAKLFAEPTGFQKYPSVQEMLMANMQKLMQAAPAR